MNPRIMNVEPHCPHISGVSWLPQIHTATFSLLQSAFALNVEVVFAALRATLPRSRHAENEKFGKAVGRSTQRPKGPAWPTAGLPVLHFLQENSAM